LPRSALKLREACIREAGCFQLSEQLGALREAVLFHTFFDVDDLLDLAQEPRVDAAAS